jgi:hypothetical protein
MEATRAVCDIVEDIIEDGDFDYPPSTFADSIFDYSKLIQQKNMKTLNRIHRDHESSVHPYYEINPSVAVGLAELARLDGEFFDYLSDVCALNISAGAPLPKPLREFAYSVLKGQLSRPTKGSRPRKKNWLERSLIWSLTLQVVEDYGLVLTRNDEGSHRHSACDAVSEALTVCGRKTTYSEVKNLMVHPDYARLRAEFEVSRSIMARWHRASPPENALSEEYWDFWTNAARADVLDILKAFSPPSK